MLYVTTRNDRDAFTVHRALYDNQSSGSGLYLPLRFPAFSQTDLDALLAQPFNPCCAQMLNLLFGTNLSGWDLDFSIGRKPIRFQDLGQKTILAEAWHNPDWNYSRLEKTLAGLLGCGNPPDSGNWVSVGIRAAVLFGIFAELRQAGFDQKVDITAVSGEFSVPISAWYARSWGLPIGNIVCCCNENSGIWDLICHGQMRTDGISSPTDLPEADITLPRNLERLIYACGGTQEVKRYLEACQTGRMYSVEDTMLEKLRQGLFVSVVSSRRTMDTIPSVRRIRGHLLSPYAALAYAGLQDYRSKTGATRPCVVFSEKSPLCDRAVTARALGIPPESLENYI